MTTLARAQARATSAPASLWVRAGRWPGLVVAFAVVALLRLGQLAVVIWMAPDSDASLPDRLLIWDGGWLINVATEGYPSGYSYADDGSITGNGYAFFPLFPMLVRGVTWLGLTPKAASLLVVALAGVASSLLIYLLGVSLWNRRVGYPLLVLVCAQPMAVVLIMGYTEGVFLALVAGSLLAAHRRVWWVAGLTGLGAALTRPTGAAVGVALAVAAVLLWRQAQRGQVTLRRGELRYAGMAAAVALAGVPAFLLWVGWRVGDLDAWFTVQTAGWGTTFDFGRSVGEFIVNTLRSGDGIVELTTAVLVLGAIVFCLLAAVDRVWPPLLAYGLIALVLVVGQAGYWHSKPRLLVPVLLLAGVPLARALGKVPALTAALLLAAWAAFGLWFGAHMITVWQFTI